MNWNTIASDYLAVADQVFNELRAPVEALAAEIARRLKAGNKVMICGNGGSAADAQHIAGEFLNRFLKERRPYAGMALTTDTSTMTAIGNDYSFDQVFEKQVQGLGRAGDVLLVISTSGNAANVLRAVDAAKAMNIYTVALTGGAGGQVAGRVDCPLSVSCTRSTPRIQEGHQLLFHLLCERLEEIMEG
jgi:D-sedoheptulose 7-phosphate isomerase